MSQPHMTPRRRRTAFALAAMLALAPVSQSVRAADPIGYSVNIAPTGDATLDKLMSDASTLKSLSGSEAIGPFALVARTRFDLTRFRAALDSLGFYDGKLNATIDGMNIDADELLGRLDGLPQGASVPVAITATPGPLFRLRRVTVQGSAPADATAQLGLTAGAPAVAGDVLAARNRLLAALRDAGYATARVDAPVATLDPGARALDVSFAVNSGPRVDLGEISIDGLQRVNPGFVRGRLSIHTGELFSPASIEAARADLAAQGVFSSVNIDTSGKLDAQGRLPVQVEVTERPRHQVTFGAGYSTDQGGNVSASWTDRNVFGNAEQLTFSAKVDDLGGTAVQSPGYDLGALYRIPDWLHRDQALTLQLDALREYLDAYDRTGVVGGATVSRVVSPHITVSGGLTGVAEHVTQEGTSNDYRFLQVPLSLGWDDASNKLDPVSGFRANVSVTPTTSFGGTRSSDFAIMQVGASAYFDLTGNGRSVLAMRALIGSTQGATVFEIPPDQRFYAGGSGSVRGFRYQSIGPQFPSHNPTGGTAVDTGSIEFRQRFGSSYGAAVFVDAGQVSTNGVPFEGQTRVGAGLGARYYTSIGPLRLDVALPVNRAPHGDAFEVYLGIGQAF